MILISNEEHAEFMACREAIERAGEASREYRSRRSADTTGMGPLLDSFWLGHSARGHASTVARVAGVTFDALAAARRAAKHAKETGRLVVRPTQYTCIKRQLDPSVFEKVDAYMSAKIEPSKNQKHLKWRHVLQLPDRRQREALLKYPEIADRYPELLAKLQIEIAVPPTQPVGGRGGARLRQHLGWVPELLHRLASSFGQAYEEFTHSNGRLLCFSKWETYRKSHWWFVETQSTLYGCVCAKELSLTELLKVQRQLFSEWTETSGDAPAVDATLLNSCSDAVSTVDCLLCAKQPGMRNVDVKCALRTCANCPVNRLPPPDAFSDEVCNWTVLKKGKDEAGKTAYVPHAQSATHRGFVMKLYEKMDKFFWHQFRRYYCYDQKQLSYGLDDHLEMLLMRILIEAAAEAPNDELRRSFVTTLHKLLRVVIMERDYGENHTCHDTLEPQSAYWCYRQITLMPHILFRLGDAAAVAVVLAASSFEQLIAVLNGFAPPGLGGAVSGGASSSTDEPLDCPLLAASASALATAADLTRRKDYTVITSDYHAHDNNFSQNALRVVLGREQAFARSVAPGKVDLGFVLAFLWSDNANHFKCAQEFLGLSEFMRQPWNLCATLLVLYFTCEHHGSSEVDSVTFQLKEAMRRAETKDGSRWGDAPKNGKEAEAFLNRVRGHRVQGTKEPTGKKTRNTIHHQTFPYLGQADLQLTPEAETLAPAVTRKISALRGTGTPGAIMVSVLPCGCLSCLTGQWDRCLQAEMRSYVNERVLGKKELWVRCTIKEKVNRRQAVTRAMVGEDAFVELASKMVDKGRAVAIAADSSDPANNGHSFAMVNALGPIEKLSKDVKTASGWLRQGWLVFKGEYYERMPGTHRFFCFHTENGKKPPPQYFMANHVRHVFEEKWAPTTTGGWRGVSVFEILEDQYEMIQGQS
tara:strand:- start:377 stop:3151 length:2775 start_codon:yes stop_codon:yes gene_type:complete